MDNTGSPIVRLKHQDDRRFMGLLVGDSGVRLLFTVYS